MLESGVLQALNLVEAGVVELGNQRFDGSPDDAVITEPAGVRVDLAFDGHLDLKTMAMHTTALVPLRDVRKLMGCFKLEITGQSYAHG